MKVAVLAAMLTVFQAAPPIPREATKHISQKSNEIKGKSAIEKAPTTQAPAQNPRKAQAPEQYSPSEAAHNEEEPKPVRVAPVDVRKDRADYLYIAASLALTIATLVIAGIAVMQARAAKASVDALIDSERAWVKIRPDAFKLIICARLDWVITNTGRTTARIIEVRARCKKYGPTETLDSTPVFRNDPILFPRVPLAPQDTLNVWSYIEAGEDRTYEGLTQQSIGEIREKGHDLVAYASVSYLDSFGKSHISRFCYYYAKSWDQFRINLKAPSTYHECD
jgi:hypothetical protein